jgi:hypothetical protein
MSRSRDIEIIEMNIARQRMMAEILKSGDRYERRLHAIEILQELLEEINEDEEALV